MRNLGRVLFIVFFLASATTARAEIPIWSMVQLEKEIDKAKVAQNWSLLIQLTEQFIEKYNDAPELHYNLGCYHFNLKDYAAALASFTKAQKMAEVNKPWIETAKRRNFIRILYYNMANTTARLGNYQDALDLYSKAVNFHPEELTPEFGENITRNYDLVAKARDAAAAKLKNLGNSTPREKVTFEKGEEDLAGVAPEDLGNSDQGPTEEWKREALNESQSPAAKDEGVVGSPADDGTALGNGSSELGSFFELQTRMQQINAQIRERELLRRMRAGVLTDEQQKLLNMIAGWRGGSSRRFKEIGENSLEAHELGIPDWRSRMSAGDDTWNEKVVDWNVIPNDDSLFPEMFKDVFQPQNLSWSGATEDFGHAGEVNAIEKETKVRYTFIGKFVDRKDRRPFPIANREGFIVDPDSFRFEGGVQSYAVYQGDLGTTLLFVKGRSLANTRFSYSLVESEGSYQKGPTEADRKSHIEKILPELQTALNEFIDPEDTLDEKAQLLEGFFLAQGYYIKTGAHIDAYIQRPTRVTDRFNNLTRILLRLPGRPEGADGMSCSFWAETYVLLARYLGIPTRRIIGYWNGDQNLELIRGEFHGWARYFSPETKQWVEVNPTPMAEGDYREGDLRVQRFIIWKEIKRLKRKLGKLATGSRTRAQRIFDFWTEKEKMLGEEARIQEQLETLGRQVSRLNLKEKLTTEEQTFVAAFHANLEARLESLYQISQRPRFNPKHDPIFARLELDYVAAIFEVILRYRPEDEAGRLHRIAEWIDKQLSESEDLDALYQGVASNEDYQVIMAQKKLYLRSRRSFIWKDLKIDLQKYEAYRVRLTEAGKVTVLAFGPNLSEILRPGQAPKSIRTDSGALDFKQFDYFHLYNDKDEYAISYRFGNPNRYRTILENGRVIDDMRFDRVFLAPKSKTRLVEVHHQIESGQGVNAYETLYWQNEDLFKLPNGNRLLNAFYTYRSGNPSSSGNAKAPIFLDAENFIVGHVDKASSTNKYFLNGREQVLAGFHELHLVEKGLGERAIQAFPQSQNAFFMKPSFFKFEQGRLTDVTAEWRQNWVYHYLVSSDLYVLVKGQTPCTYTTGNSVVGRSQLATKDGFAHHNEYYVKHHAAPPGLYAIHPTQPVLKLLNFDLQGRAVQSSNYHIQSVNVGRQPGQYIAAVTNPRGDQGFVFRNGKLDTLNFPRLVLNPETEEDPADDLYISSTPDLRYSLVRVSVYGGRPDRYFFNELRLTTFRHEGEFINHKDFSYFKMEGRDDQFILSFKSDYENRWSELKKLLPERDWNQYVEKTRSLIQSKKMELADLAFILRSALLSHRLLDNQGVDLIRKELADLASQNLLRIPQLNLPLDERIRMVDFALGLSVGTYEYSDEALMGLAQALNKKKISVEAEEYFKLRLKDYRGLQTDKADRVNSYPQFLRDLDAAFRKVHGRPYNDY